MGTIKDNLKKILFLLILSFVVLFTFFQRDLTPRNELKYLSIVNEAIERGNFFVFYNHGIPYADKPPLYFWLIIFTKKVIGSYSKVTLGLLTLIPAIIISFSMDRLTKNYLDKGERLLASGILFTTGYFLGGILVLRMDILMTMFILLTLETFFKIYEKKNKPYHIYFFYLYIFLGVFTKGPVGIIFPILTIFLFLFRKKDLGFFKNLKPIKGFFLLLILLSSWFLAIYFEGGKQYLYELVVNQTIGRAHNSFIHARPFYYYFKNLGVDLLPWSLLFFITFFISFKNKLERVPIETFFSSAIIINILFMSLISGKLDIYLLPIYPFIVFYTLLIAKKIEKDRVWKFSILPFSIVLVLLLPIYLVVSFFIELPVDPSIYLYLLLIIVLIFGGVSLDGIRKNKFSQGCWGIVLGTYTILLIFSLQVENYNKDFGVNILAQKAKIFSREGKGISYYAFNFTDAASMDVYLGKKVINLNSISELEKITSNQDICLFIQEKDIKRNKELNIFLRDMQLLWNSKNYFLYTNKKGGYR